MYDSPKTLNHKEHEGHTKVHKGSVLKILIRRN